MSGDHEIYKNMVLAFRMSDLQTLMVFAGRSKTGRKKDSQARAVELCRLNSVDISLKIKELSQAMYRSLGASSQSDSYSSSTSAGSRNGVTSYSNPVNDPILTSPPKVDISVAHTCIYIHVQNTLDNTTWVKPCALHTQVRKQFLQVILVQTIIEGATREERIAQVQ